MSKVVRKELKVIPPQIKNVTLVGCFAHERRGFTDALKALPKSSDVTRTNAVQGLDPGNMEQLDALLPWSKSIPGECKIPSKN